MAFCTNCGSRLDDGYEFCPECGNKVSPVLQIENTVPDFELAKPCPRCGEMMPSDAFYCLNCGATFDKTEEEFAYVQNKVRHQFGTWKNKWIALLLCVFLGWMGAHKYYEGKIGMGILYTFTLGLFFVGWIVDIIILAFKPNPYMAKR